MTRLAAPIAAISLFALTACADETISGYVDADATFRLVEIDGAPFAATADISFPEPGIARGTAPCNSWSAAQTAPYPWIEIGPIAATKRACPELNAEQRFFSALADMAIAEISGDVLILTGEDGGEMVFRATP